MDECLFLVASHLDEVEDHLFGMIYYDKLDLRSFSFGVKDYLVGKAMDEDLGANYPYIRDPLKGEKSERGETLRMECFLLKDHSHGVDGYCETNSFGVNDDRLREAIWNNDPREIMDE